MNGYTSFEEEALPVGANNQCNAMWTEEVNSQKPSVYNGITDAENNLPINEKIASKNWKIRLPGYQEQLDKDPEYIFSNHSFQISGFLAETNPTVQEKGIQVVLKAISSCTSLEQISMDSMVKNLVEKVMAMNKPNLKQITSDLLLKLYEVGDQAAIMNALEILCNNKNAKVSCNALNCISIILNGCRGQQFNVMSVLSTIEKCANSTQPTSKSTAFQLIKDIIKWMGSDVIKFLKNLKKVQIDELTAYASEVQNNSQNLAPEFITKNITGSVKSYIENTNKVVNDLSNTNFNKPKPDFNAFEQARPIDIFMKHKFDENWCDKVLNSAKWSDKKLFLDHFLKSADVPRINGYSCGTVVNMAKRLVGDSNVQVQLCAQKIFGALAKGMQKDFGFYIKQHFIVILNQLKNTKKNVSEQALQTLNDAFYSFNPEEVIEDVKDLLTKLNNPTIKSNLMRWLDTYVTNCESNVKRLNNFVKIYVPIIVKLIDDASLEVRNQAMQVLGTLMRIKQGDKNLEKLLKAIPEAKMQRIISQSAPAEKTLARKSQSLSKFGKQTCDRMETSNNNGRYQQEEAINDPALYEQIISETHQMYPGGKSVCKLPSEVNNLFEKPNATYSVKSNFLDRAKNLNSNDKDIIQENAFNCLNDVQSCDNNQNPSSISNNQLLDNIDRTICNSEIAENIKSNQSFEESEQILRNEQNFKIPIELLKSNNWKDKSEALGTIAGLVGSDSFKQEQSVPIQHVLKKRTKDFKDGNIYIIKAILSLFEEISKKSVLNALSLMMPFLIEKLSDKNLIDKVHSIINYSIGSLGVQIVLNSLLSNLKSKQLMPRTYVESIYIIKNLIKGHKDDIRLKDIVVFGKILLMNNNQQVRLEATNLFKQLQDIMGSDQLKQEIVLVNLPTNTLRLLENDLKAALSDSKNRNPSVGKLSVRGKSLGFDKIGSSSKLTFLESSKMSPGPNRMSQNASMVSNSHYGSKITPNGKLTDNNLSLLRSNSFGQSGGKSNSGNKSGIFDIQGFNKKLSDKTFRWNDIIDHFNQAERSLRDGEAKIKPNQKGLSELIKILQVKLQDSNKTSLRAVISFTNAFIMSIGQEYLQFNRQLTHKIAENLTDKNLNVRQETFDCLEVICENIGAENIMGVMFSCIDKNKPELRLTALNFVLKHVKVLHKVEPKVFSQPLINAIQDKSKEIRNLAEKLLSEIVKDHGEDALGMALRELKPYIATTIRQTIRKVSEDGKKSLSREKYYQEPQSSVSGHDKEKISLFTVPDHKSVNSKKNIKNENPVNMFSLQTNSELDMNNKNQIIHDAMDEEIIHKDSFEQKASLTKSILEISNVIELKNEVVQDATVNYNENRLSEPNENSNFDSDLFYSKRKKIRPNTARTIENIKNVETNTYITTNFNSNQDYRKDFNALSEIADKDSLSLSKTPYSEIVKISFPSSFNVEEPKDFEIEGVRQYLANEFGHELCAKMFSYESNKVIESINLMKSILSNINFNQSKTEGIFRWIYLRVYDCTRDSILECFLSLLEKLFCMHIEQNLFIDFNIINSILIKIATNSDRDLFEKVSGFYTNEKFQESQNLRFSGESFMNALTGQFYRNKYKILKLMHCFIRKIKCPQKILKIDITFENNPNKMLEEYDGSHFLTEDHLFSIAQYLSCSGELGSVCQELFKYLMNLIDAESIMNSLSRKGLNLRSINILNGYGDVLQSKEKNYNRLKLHDLLEKLELIEKLNFEQVKVALETLGDYFKLSQKEDEIELKGWIEANFVVILGTCIKILNKYFPSSNQYSSPSEQERGLMFAFLFKNYDESKLLLNALQKVMNHGVFMSFLVYEDQVALIGVFFDKLLQAEKILNKNSQSSNTISKEDTHKVDTFNLMITTIVLKLYESFGSESCKLIFDVIIQTRLKITEIQKNESNNELTNILLKKLNIGVISLNRYISSVIEKNDRGFTPIYFLIGCIEYLSIYDNQLPRDDAVVTSIKILLKDLVKTYSFSIWGYYNNAKEHVEKDLFLSRWINIQLSTPENNNESQDNGKSSVVSKISIDEKNKMDIEKQDEAVMITENKIVPNKMEVELEQQNISFPQTEINTYEEISGVKNFNTELNSNNMIIPKKAEIDINFLKQQKDDKIESTNQLIMDLKQKFMGNSKPQNHPTNNNQFENENSNLVLIREDDKKSMDFDEISEKDNVLGNSIEKDHYIENIDLDCTPLENQANQGQMSLRTRSNSKRKDSFSKVIRSVKNSKNKQMERSRSASNNKIFRNLEKVSPLKSNVDSKYNKKASEKKNVGSSSVKKQTLTNILNDNFVTKNQRVKTPNKNAELNNKKKETTKCSLSKSKQQVVSNTKSLRNITCDSNECEVFEKSGNKRIATELKNIMNKYSNSNSSDCTVLAMKIKDLLAKNDSLHQEKLDFTNMSSTKRDYLESELMKANIFMDQRNNKVSSELIVNNNNDANDLLFGKKRSACKLFDDITNEGNAIVVQNRSKNNSHSKGIELRNIDISNLSNGLNNEPEKFTENNYIQDNKGITLTDFTDNNLTMVQERLTLIRQKYDHNRKGNVENQKNTLKTIAPNKQLNSNSKDIEECKKSITNLLKKHGDC